MKVSIITMQFPSLYETFASNDIKTMKDLGIDVRVYGMKPQSKDHIKLVKERKLSNIKIDNNTIIKSILGILIAISHPILLYKLVKYILFTKQNHLMNYFKLLLLLPSSFYIFNKIKQDPPKIVHLYWGHYPALVGLLIKESKLDIKVTIFLGAYDLEYDLGITRTLVSICDKVFTHSKGNKKLLLSRYDINNDKVIVFYRGVDLDKFNQESQAKEKNSFTTVGRLIKAKGQDDVILAFSKIIKIIPDATLKIIGSGPNELSLKKQVQTLGISNAVTFLGHLSHNEVIDYLNKSDYFLYMSTYEGDRLPNVIKEAMVTKNICIVTRTKDIEELVIDKENGFLVNYNEPDEVVKIVREIKDNIKFQNTIRDNAYKKICNDFNIKVSIQKIINVWRSL